MSETQEICKPTKYLGKYRGTVINDIDPKKMGRIQAMVPDVLGLMLSTWAMPCLPFGGLQGGIFSIPTIGTGVWIEFEQGDPDYPIWVGSFPGSIADVPAMANTVPPSTPGMTFQTPLQNGITISDVPGPTGGILIKSSTGASIMVNDLGITIQNGKGASIVMAGKSVAINEAALVIT